MTMTTTNTKNEFTGNGTLKDYAFTFRFIEPAHVKVYVNTVLQVVDTDYTLSYTSDLVGGDISFIVAPSDTLPILIQRETPKRQDNNYNLGPFPAESVETNEDKLVAMIQEVGENTPSTPTPIFPAPVADEIIGWDATGTSLENKVYPDITQAETDAADALAAANAADTKADTALTNANSARTIADTANAKADQNITDIANTDAKAVAALAKATNNEADIAAIDVSNYVDNTTYTTEQGVQDGRLDTNEASITQNIADITANSSKITLLEEAELAISGFQPILNNQDTNITEFVVDADSAVTYVLFFEIIRRTDLKAAASNGVMYLQYDGSQWNVDRGITNGNFDGVEFSMNNLGGNSAQLVVTCDDLLGTNYLGEFKYKAWKFATNATFAGPNTDPRFSFIEKLKVGEVRGNIHARTALHIDSKEGGVLFPFFSTVERDTVWSAPLDASDEGTLIFNTDVNSLQMHAGGSWNTLGTTALAGYFAEAFDSFPDDDTYLNAHGQGGSFANVNSCSFEYTGQQYQVLGDVPELNATQKFTLQTWGKTTDFLETPRGGSIGMFFKSGLDATYGDDPSKLTASATDTDGVPTVTDGWVDFLNGRRTVTYPADNFKCDQEGSIKFLLKTHYSGAPATTQYILTSHNSSVNNSIFFRHNTNGKLEVRVYGGTLNRSCAAPWSPVAGQSYTIELTFDYVENRMRLFIDGVIPGGAGVGWNSLSGVRDISAIDTIRLGGYVSNNYTTSNFALKQVEFYATKNHVADYNVPAAYGYGLFEKYAGASNFIQASFYEGRIYCRIATAGNMLTMHAGIAAGTGIWHLMTFVYDGTQVLDEEKLKVYFDNALQAATMEVTGIAPSTGPDLTGFSLTLAKVRGTNAKFMFDEPAVFDDVLAISELNSIYNNGNPDITPKLKQWWRNGDDVMDSAPTIVNQKSLLNATLINGAVIVADAPTAGAGAPGAGGVYWNTTTNCLRLFMNNQWLNWFPITTWINGADYYADQVVIDDTTHILYRCKINHTASGFPNTLIDDIANWNALGVDKLNDLADVDTTGVVLGDVLEYDGTNYLPTHKHQMERELVIKELAATPANPVAGYLKVYAIGKNLYILDSNGRETLLEVCLDTLFIFDANYIDGSTINVASGALTTVVASTVGITRKVQMYDTTGLLLGWYVGGTLTWVTGPGTNETIDVEIPNGSLVQVRSLTAEAGTAGELSANFLG